MYLSSSIATRLEYQHKTLLELVQGLTDDQIRRQIIIGKWSVFENIVHLSTYQHTCMYRLEQVLSGTTTVFPKYTAERDPLFLDSCTKSTREVMVDLLNTRKMLSVKILSLTKEELQKTGRHEVYGAMDTLHWIEFFLLHEAHHLFTIFKLVAASPNAKTNIESDSL